MQVFPLGTDISCPHTGSSITKITVSPAVSTDSASQIPPSCYHLSLQLPQEHMMTTICVNVREDSLCQCWRRQFVSMLEKLALKLHSYPTATCQCQIESILYISEWIPDTSQVETILQISEWRLCSWKGYLVHFFSFGSKSTVITHRSPTDHISA